MSGPLGRLGAAVAVAVLAGTSPCADAAAAAPRHVTMIFTGDVSGYLEPCG